MGALTSALDTELERRVIWAPVALAAGILLFFALRSEPTWLFLASCGALAAGGACLSGWLTRRGRPMISTALWCVCLCALGVNIAALRSYTVAASVLGAPYYGPVEGRLIEIDRSGKGAMRLTLDRVFLPRLPMSKQPARVRFSVFGMDAERVPPAGARIMTTAHLMPPKGPAEPGGFDFRRHAWFQRLGAVGYTRVPVLVAVPAPNRVGFLQLRMALSRRVQEVLPGQAGAFAAALMSGDRSALDPQTLSTLRMTNLAHLLAISGLHMGLLVGFVFTAARYGSLIIAPGIASGRKGKKLAAVLALLAAGIYLGLSGGNVATQRAFVMAAIILLAVLMDQRALSLHSVALAAMAVLLLRPEAVTGPGFQMSFAATTALIVVFSALQNRAQGGKGRSALWRIFNATVLVSAVAGISTLPVAAAHFNQISHYGLLANVLSVPLMGVLIMPLAVIAALLMPLGLDRPALTVMGMGLDWILTVAQSVALWPGAVTFVPNPPDAAFAILMLGLLVMALMTSRLRWGGALLIGLGVIWWSVAQRPDVLIAQGGALVGLKTPEGRALSKASGAGFTAKVWLENDGTRASQAAAHGLWDAALRSFPDAGRLHVLHGKTGLRSFTGCQRADIAVFSEPAPEGLPCRVFDAVSLRRSGSVALYLRKDGPVQIVTAAQKTGQRIWTQVQRQ